MKRVLITISVITILCLLSPGARSEVYMDYQFPDGINWAIGGFETYDIILRGEVIGEARIDYHNLTMMDANAFKLEWNQSWTNEDGTTSSVNTDSRMRASDFKSYMVTRIETVGDEEWRFEGNYTGENLQFGAYYPGEAERVESNLTRSGRFCDLDILPFILRNIPFEEGNFVTLNAIDVSTHSFVTPIATVSGSEIVETTNTQYDCWAVNVSLGNNGFTAWYSKNDKHYLVKIRYNDREVVLNHHS
jgi:hypothetical protein